MRNGEDKAHGCQRFEHDEVKTTDKKRYDVFVVTGRSLRMDSLQGTTVIVRPEVPQVARCDLPLDTPIHTTH